MAIDEFGREVRSSERSSYHSNHHSHHQQPHHHHHQPFHSYDSPDTPPNDPPPRSRSPPYGRYSDMALPSTRQRGPRARSRSFSPEPRRPHHQQPHQHHTNQNQHQPHQGQSRRRYRYAIDQYMDDYLLCEVMWNENQQQSRAANGNVTTYDQYRREYCTDLIRSFFNAHLDDGWFKIRYSPLHQRNEKARAVERAIAEAHAIMDQIQATSETAFIEGARLGVDSSAEANSNGSANSSNKRKQSQQLLNDTDIIPTKQTASNSSNNNQDDGLAVPSSHILSGAKCALELLEVPPHVTDAQLSLALAEYSSSPPLRMCSSTVGLATTGGNVTASYCNSLYRTAWAIFINEEAKEEMLENLAKNNLDQQQQSGIHHHHQQYRDISSSSSTMLQLDVDCTDPYGRTDVDANEPPQEEVIPRKCTITVRTAPHKTVAQMLSATVSSHERIPRDKAAALVIARALDTAQTVPRGVRLDDLVERLFGNDSDSPNDADVLDVAIAYLRRVHLFGFYHNCQAAKCEGDILTGHYPAGTVYLRVANPVGVVDAANDLRVQRLDESIAKALEESTARVDSSDDKDGQVCREAAEIEGKEASATEQWLEDHALLDSDGRARCSLHFCRKLFKDKTYLYKHLQKKHAEYLDAERAKAHDPYMMSAWEAEEVRPIPQVVVDCGPRYGLIPVTVTGATPDVVDPEPGLLQKEEEARQLRQAQIRQQQQQQQLQQQQAQKVMTHSNNNQSSSMNPMERGGFVDVDDMVDEKVELSFDKVVLPPPKKKKRKKKIL